MTNNNSWPCVCDWNLDGRKDLLVGQEGLSAPCNVYVYLNEGTDSLPVFGDSTPVLHNGTPFTDRRTVPLLLDLDRDGKRDLVLGEWYSSVRFYANVGTDTNPVFNTYINLVQPDPDSFLNGNPPRINFTDWDGDGDLDMITCDYYGSVFVRRNITPAGVEETHERRTRNDERRTDHRPRRSLPPRVSVSPRLRVAVSPRPRRLPSSSTSPAARSCPFAPVPTRISALAPGAYRQARANRKDPEGTQGH